MSICSPSYVCSGSGFSRRASGYGKKVCIIEQGPTRDAEGKRTGAGCGGTCVNVGCVPKKLMYFAAMHREMVVGPAATAGGYGISVQETAPVDWASLKARRDAHVAKLQGGYKGKWEKVGMDVLIGKVQSWTNLASLFYLLSRAEQCSLSPRFWAVSAHHASAVATLWVCAQGTAPADSMTDPRHD